MALARAERSPHTTEQKGFTMQLAVLATPDELEHINAELQRGNRIVLTVNKSPISILCNDSETHAQVQAVSCQNDTILVMVQGGGG